jgi:hypothetical protein
MMTDNHDDPEVAKKADSAVEDHEEGNTSFPAAEEIRINAQSKSRGGQKLLITVAASILIALTLLGALLGVLMKNQGGRLFKSAARKASFSNIVKYVSAEGVSSNKDFYSPSSPQYKAAKWLAHDDQLNLPVPETAVDTKNGYDFVTRYVLAVNYFALNGPAWKNQFQFLSDSPTCMWTSVLYDGENFYRSGVMCDSDGTINALYLGKKKQQKEVIYLKQLSNSFNYF